jgi:hypothetical protein
MSCLEGKQLPIVSCSDEQTLGEFAGISSMMAWTGTIQTILKQSLKRVHPMNTMRDNYVETTNCTLAA